MKTIHTKQKRTSIKKSRSLVTGSIIAILIAISPYIFYSYESFPDVKVWETSFFTYDSAYYGSVQSTAYWATSKIVSLMFLILWFFTCKEWWYHVIIIPIAMYFFQLITVFNDDAKYVDEVEIYYVIPVMMVVIPIVYFIRIKLFDKHVYGIDLEKMNAELADYERKEKELLDEQNE